MNLAKAMEIYGQNQNIKQIVDDDLNMRGIYISQLNFNKLIDFRRIIQEGIDRDQFKGKDKPEKRRGYRMIRRAVDCASRLAVFHLVLTDGITRIPLGVFASTHGFESAARAAYKVHSAVMRSLTLPQWRITDGEKDLALESCKTKRA
ncbi:hypothetical protein [Methylomagnum ishizawai]|uniref:hypothetical protein n=1 Tax=Methylomagnum ishizawai TaxID=1760988 RepID=UPI001C337C07|nr:hypothetical protein [Methylomagnum ishizawai]BBL75451.1 hypothetical protein MishRS11D_25490 [Methylomagnum ishizawai]